LAKEALATHHKHSLEADSAVELKAKEQEQRRQKREAEEHLKAFKAADLDKKYEVAAELKKLHLEERQKKREADEHLKGYRER
jgi:polysaccharide pyruvyl transferase WcaK-like protein